MHIVSSLGQLKPQPWPVDPLNINPEWRWYWTKGGPRTMHYPLWESGGQSKPVSVWDYPEATLGGGAVWRASRFGSSIRINESGDYLENSEGTFDPFGSAWPITWWAHLRILNDTGGGGVIGMADRNSGSGRWALLHGSTEPRVFLNGDIDLRPFYSFDDNPRLLTYIGRAADEHELWLNDDLLSTSTDTVSPLTFNTWSFGRIGDSTPSSTSNDMDVYAGGVIQGYAVTENQLRQLMRDPWGPVRPQRTTFITTFEDAGNTPTYSITNPYWSGA